MNQGLNLELKTAGAFSTFLWFLAPPRQDAGMDLAPMLIALARVREPHAATDGDWAGRLAVLGNSMDQQVNCSWPISA